MPSAAAQQPRKECFAVKYAVNYFECNHLFNVLHDLLAVITICVWHARTKEHAAVLFCWCRLFFLCFRCGWNKLFARRGENGGDVLMCVQVCVYDVNN